MYAPKSSRTLERWTRHENDIQYPRWQHLLQSEAILRGAVRGEIGASFPLRMAAFLCFAINKRAIGVHRSNRALLGRHCAFVLLGAFQGEL